MTETKTQALTIPEIPELQVIEKGIQCQIAEPFLPIIQLIAELDEKAKSIVVTSVDDKENIKSAKKLWQIAKNARVEAEKIRKSLKEDSLIRGRAIDGLGNYIKAKLQIPEKHLHEQWKYAEIEAEKKKAALIEDRMQKLIEAGSTISHAGIGEMSENDFNQLLEMTQEATKRRIEEQRKLEEIKRENERKEAEERERIRLENERLKKEAAEREAEAKKEREAAEAQIRAERAAAEEKLAEERAKRELEEKARREAEAEKQRLEDERKAKEEAERKAKEEAERKERALKEAEEKRLAEEARKAAAAPDKDKIKKYLDLIGFLEKPELKTDEGQKVMDFIIECEKKLVQVALNKLNEI